MDKRFLCYSLFLLSFIIPSFVFAQSQSLCYGSVAITDTSQAEPNVLVIVSNSSQASFTVNGPKTYSGSGYYWAQQGISPGTYTITWIAVSGCKTPPSETKTTDSRGSLAFAGNYKNQTQAIQTSLPPPSPTSSTKPPLGHFMTVSSYPPSASVFINSLLVGTAPVTTRLPENVSIKITCTLPNYSDYNYMYPAVGTLPNSVNSINSDWTCTLIKKQVQAAPVVDTQIQPQQPGQTSNKTITPASQKEVPVISVLPQASAEPRGFFARLWKKILSIIW